MENEVSSQQDNNPGALACGGRAPADRACGYLLGNGQKCCDWAIRGQKYCFRHDRFLHARPERPIDVPLLEDDDSLIYVLSQTIQSLAWGTLPTSNGHTILTACRLVQNCLDSRLESAKLRFKLRRLGIPEHEIFESQHLASSSAPTPEQGADEIPTAAPGPETASAPSALNSEPGSSNPVKVRPGRICFRDLKKDWDKSLQRCENAVGDMYIRRYGETQQQFLASHATPLTTCPRSTAKSSVPVPWPKPMTKPSPRLRAQVQTRFPTRP